MVAGHLRERHGYFQIVLSYTDEYGKRQTPSKSTGFQSCFCQLHLECLPRQRITDVPPKPSQKVGGHGPKSPATSKLRGT